jgi:hypothetical protein
LLVAPEAARFIVTALSNARRSTTVRDDELAALILPWAKENRPDAYTKTLSVASRPEAFRAYLARLIELRWEAEPEWHDQVPLRALEETAITVRMRHPELGVEIEVQGRLDPETRKPRRGRQFGFTHMADAIDKGVSFESYHKIITAWDLETI